MTSSNSEDPVTPVESDNALEPVDLSEIDHQRLLFYLAGRVPVPIQELAEDSKQSAEVLQKFFRDDLQNQVDIDSTGFVRLMDSARKPVIQASKSHIKAGREQLEAGQSSMENEFFYDAVNHFEKGVKILEQVESRLEVVNHPSKKIKQRVESAQAAIERAKKRMGDSADRVEKLLDEDTSGDSSDTPTESSTPASDSDAREEMVKLVRDLYGRLERVPKTTEFPEDAEYSPNDFYMEFGNWDKALKAAGIDKEQEMLDDIERVAEKLGRAPTSTDMDEYGTYSGANYSSYFDSWSTALRQSGIEEDRADRMLEKLSSLHKRIDRLPKRSDINNVSGASQQEYIQVFGSWDEALEAAGIDKRQYLIEDLKQVAAEVGDRPTKTTYNRVGEYSPTMLLEFFGSWDGALEAAALVSKSASQGKQRKTKSKISDKYSNGGRNSSSSHETGSDRINHSALENSWKTIPTDERITEQFLLKVTKIDKRVGDRKTARLDVRDKDGREFKMDIWSKHDVYEEWKEDRWYALENTRGKVWELESGTTRKQLSSTKDLSVIELGADFEPPGTSDKDSSKRASESQQSDGTTSKVSIKSSSESSASNNENVSTSNSLPSQSELWQDFHQVTKQLGQVPNYKEFSRMSNYSGGYLTSRVGTWDEVKQSYREWASKRETDLVTNETGSEGNSVAKDTKTSETDPEETTAVSENINSERTDQNRRAVDGSVEQTIESKSDKHSEDVQEAHSDQTAATTDTDPTQDEGDDNSGGILNEIADEFEELS